jgi:hypothetical protein
MSEQTVETTLVETSATVPFYKNKKVVFTAVAVTAAVVVMTVLKFKSNDESEGTDEITSSPADASSPKK